MEITSQSEGIFLISAVLDIEGLPKKPLEGNLLCWFGNLEYCTKDLHDPDQKLVQNYVKRAKQYGKQNVGQKVADRALHDWPQCEFFELLSTVYNTHWVVRRMWSEQRQGKQHVVIMFFLIRKHCAGTKDIYPHRPERFAAPGGAGDVDERS